MRLFYLKIPEDRFVPLLVAEAHTDPARATDAKWRALERLGVPREEGHSPLEAWALALCRANGLPETLPIPDELAEAILEDPDAYRFMWLLA